MRCSAYFLAGLAALSTISYGAERPRLFITESGAVAVSGRANLGDLKGSMALDGGTTPNSTEVMRSFQNHCPGVLITSSRDKADYIVRFDHEGVNPTTLFVRGNKVAVFNQNDDLVYTTSTRLLNSAVKNVCRALMRVPAK